MFNCNHNSIWTFGSKSFQISSVCFIIFYLFNPPRSVTHSTKINFINKSELPFGWSECELKSFFCTWERFEILVLLPVTLLGLYATFSTGMSKFPWGFFFPQRVIEASVCSKTWTCHKSPCFEALFGTLLLRYDLFSFRDWIYCCWRQQKFNLVMVLLK